MDFPTRIKLAARNILRNRRRSLVTFLTVVIGFVALSLFEGYFISVYRALEDQSIIGERLGHVTVVKRGYFEHGTQDPERYSFTAQEMETLRSTLGGMDNVALVSPRLSISGLVSNGEISQIFIGEGISAEDMAALRGEKYAHVPGRLDAAQPTAAVFGKRLADKLSLKEGDQATLMGSTIDGMVNATGVSVLSATDTGSVGTDDKFVLTTLESARRLMAFDGAERVSVLFHDHSKAQENLDAVVQALTAAGLEVEAKQWQEMSVYYGQVRGLFDAMYLFISLVVAIVVIASVFNTISMTIAERTREVGTLRALGMQVGTVDNLFVIEGMLVVLAGCVAGTVVSLGLSGLINVADLSYVPPDGTEAVPFTVTMLGENLFGSLFTLVLLAALASYLPARRASRRSITEALGHV